MANTYPMAVFSFQVDWGGSSVAFSEVSGLNMETQVIAYRDGNSQEHSEIKMPGLKKYPDIVLKRGVFEGRDDFLTWYNENILNTTDRREVKISLLNADGAPKFTATCANCFVMKYEGPTPKATGNEAAIESITLATEKVTIQFE